MSIDGTLTAVFQMNDRRTVGIATAGNLGANLQPSVTYSDGVGANQANILYNGIQTLSGGTLNVDLAGVLLDAYGSTVTAVRLKALFILNLSASNTQAFGAGTNPWVGLLNSTGTITLQPGAFILVGDPSATGMVVTASTGDILKAVGTGTDTFQLAFLGGKT